jgi:ubiquinone/menaquinone biosynthesis C-methylase UbiE
MIKEKIYRGKVKVVLQSSLYSGLILEIKKFVLRFVPSKSKIFEQGMKRFIPWSIIGKGLSFWSMLITRKARLIFEKSKTSPSYLDYNMIDIYQKQYPPLPPYGYDPRNLEKRGEERAKSMLSLIPSKKIKTFLELGCWDGMVSCVLQRLGKTTVASDISSEGFDKRAIREGVLLIKMDAHHLQFEDETFDVVFSYNAFEHFTNPEMVLREAIRVVRMGGYIYLKFGNTALSPFAAHLPRQITIPYCDVLFSKDSLQNFASSKGLGILDFNAHNSYTLEDFKKLFVRYSGQLKRVRYLEVPVLNNSRIKLIEKNPSCFKSKTRNFDNLIISSVDVLFQKTKWGMTS